MSRCADGEESCCPFAFTDRSEEVQNYGCLPSPYEIVVMRVEHGKTWACHSNPQKPCLGALRHLKQHNLPYKVIDKELVTEQSPWHLYTKDSGTTQALDSFL